MGNITSISRNGTLVASYEYDSLGQLIRENNVAENATHIIIYDASGNILANRYFAYSTDTTENLLNTTTSSFPYIYSESSWGDLLTKWCGATITYDEIGNPTKWIAYNLTWDGRELSSLNGNTLGMSFKYNSDGIRTSKTVVDTSASEDYTVKYVLDGSKILRETHIDNTTNAVIRTLDFFYDDTGVSGFTLNGTPYYYIKNLQGDVIHICSASGGIAATYVYDAWGYVVSTTAGVGQINPFRYRGYYYDSESELYYLNSRYYDPQVGRFINADGIIGANGGLQGYNMFAYCNNNPVVFIDPNGECMLGDRYYEVEFASHTLEVGDLCSACGKRVDDMFFKQPVLWTRVYLANPDLSGKEISAKVECIVATEEQRSQIAKKPTSAKALCFVAGTLVKAENGDVAIEDIEVGDYVWAHNPETGETALKRVVQTFVNETDVLVEVVIGDEIIKATPEHPFYVVGCNDRRTTVVGFGVGWVKAKDLRTGDVLRLLSGETVTVESVTITHLGTPVKVYNFEVEDFHTYFVGEDGWLVHNFCYTDKVVRQMGNDKHHGFPILLDSFAGSPSAITGGDGNRYLEYRADGYINGTAGTYVWTVDMHGNCNHRLFK